MSEAERGEATEDCPANLEKIQRSPKYSKMQRKLFSLFWRPLYCNLIFASSFEENEKSLNTYERWTVTKFNKYHR